MKKFILPAALILMVLMECSAFAAPKRIALMLEGADTASASGFNWLCLEGMRNAQVRFGNKKISTRYYNALDDKRGRRFVRPGHHHLGRLYQIPAGGAEGISLMFVPHL